METEGVRRLGELERENLQLKQLWAERDLEINAVKKVLGKTSFFSPASYRSKADGT